MTVLSPPFLPFYGLSEEIVRRAQVACGGHVKDPQSIYGCLMPDLLYARVSAANPHLLRF